MHNFHTSRPCGVAGVSFGLTGRSRGVLGLRIRAFEWLPASKLDETVSNISLIQPPHSRLWWLVLLLPAVPTLLLLPSPALPVPAVPLPASPRGSRPS
jgi:hypothetical protein